MSEAVTMGDTPLPSPTATATKKRKAAAPIEKGGATLTGGAKKARGDEDRLTLLFVHGLPTKNPRKAAASALLVGFNTQQLAQKLYDELYGGDAEGDAGGAEQHLQRLLDGGVELSPFSTKAHVVTDGPPNVTMGTVDDLVAPDARVQRQPLKVFVAKNFASRSLYPEVAVLVAPSKDAAMASLARLTAASTADNRPASVKKRGADVRAVDLTAPGFYRLSEGDFYDYERN